LISAKTEVQGGEDEQSFQTGKYSIPGEASLNTDSPSAILSHFKGHTPSYLSFLGSLVLAAVVGFGNLRAGQTHSTDEIQQLKTDVAELKKQIANDMATRREVDDVKATVIRIEDKLDKELEYHRKQ
jgi:outer membrane murein-binding lipoprotein Lpp